MTQTAYAPPAPRPRVVPENARPSLQGYWRYFRIMTTNPLEIWTERNFREAVEAGRLFGRRYMLVHDPEGIRRFLVANAENYALTEIRRAIFEPILREGLLTAEGDKWKRTRKALTPVFTPRRVEGFAAPMRAVARARAEELAQTDGATIEMSDETSRLTLHILLACLFEDTDLDVVRFTRNIDRLFAVAGTPHPFDLVGAPRWVPRIGRGEAMRVVEELRSQVRAVAETRRSLIEGGGTPPADFLTLLLQTGAEDGAPLSDEDVVDNLLTFLSAGHETTARTLTWLFYLLSEEPGARARVEAEIDALDMNAAPPEDWAGVLPYCVAVIKETLRLYPAAPLVARTAIGPDRVAGRDVPAGAELVASTWVLHRHRRLWRDPDVFDPARFLGEDGAAIHRCAFIPFGIGPRVCIGASFGMQEMVIVMAEFLKRLRFSFAGSEKPAPVMRITIQPSADVAMRVAPRA